MNSPKQEFPQDWTPQEHMAAIIESSDDAIISKDLNGTIRSWNRGAERMFGYTADEIIGKHISVLAAPDRVDEIPTILSRISRGERVEHYETRRRTQDGRILSVSLTISPIRNASGKVVGASKIARDIGEQIRYRQSLRDANESLKRANADLEQFTYSASHDLQEPLRMIAGYSEMLQRKYGKNLDPTGEKFIAYIVAGVHRMERLLRDLRTFTHTSTLSKEPTQDVDAGEALNSALEDLAVAIADNGASITWDPLPTVRMHEFQLKQLFQNLVGNAIRYRSHEAPKIHIAALRCGEQWKFSVQDNGIGIDSQYWEQIFGMFKRLHSYADYPGSGMGLAICQRIVERGGGRIWVESELGKGSTFFFTVAAGEAAKT